MFISETIPREKLEVKEEIVEGAMTVSDVLQKEIYDEPVLQLHTTDIAKVENEEIFKCEEEMMMTTEDATHEQFLCEYCAESFYNKCALKKHMSSHTGADPFNCAYCNMSFVTGHEIASHVRKEHPGEKPFTCDICSNSFSSNDELIHHIFADTETKSDEERRLYEEEKEIDEELSLGELNYSKAVKTQKCNRVKKRKGEPIEVGPDSSFKSDKKLICMYCKTSFATSELKINHFLTDSCIKTSEYTSLLDSALIPVREKDMFVRTYNAAVHKRTLYPATGKGDMAMKKWQLSGDVVKSNKEVMVQKMLEDVNSKKSEAENRFDDLIQAGRDTVSIQGELMNQPHLKQSLNHPHQKRLLQSENEQKEHADDVLKQAQDMEALKRGQENSMHEKAREIAIRGGVQVRPFPCDMCRKSFFTRNILRKHREKVHANQTPEMMDTSSAMKCPPPSMNYNNLCTLTRNGIVPLTYWCQSVGLIRHTHKCAVCSKEVTISFFQGETPDWHCNDGDHYWKESVTKNTIFDKSDFGMGKILRFVYWFAHGKTSHDFLEREMSDDEIGANQFEIDHWLSYCRDICFVWLNEHYKGEGRIGGPQAIVEIDETQIGSRKCERGRSVDGQWIVGMIELQPGEKLIGGRFRLEICPDNKRNAKTLRTIIKRHVEPGTTVMTDLWKGYSTIADDSYKHLTVDHSINFVNPDTGANTQTIRSQWRALKRLFSENGSSRDDLFRHLCEYLWRHEMKFRGNDFFLSFINICSTVCNPNQ